MKPESYQAPDGASNSGVERVVGHESGREKDADVIAIYEKLFASLTETARIRKTYEIRGANHPITSPEDLIVAEGQTLVDGMAGEVEKAEQEGDPEKARRLELLREAFASAEHLNSLYLDARAKYPPLATLLEERFPHLPALLRAANENFDPAAFQEEGNQQKAA